MFENKYFIVFGVAHPKVSVKPILFAPALQASSTNSSRNSIGVLVLSSVLKEGVIPCSFA
jgi:hypothetical protein